MLGGVQLKAGSRLVLLYGSAKRDEHKYPDPECLNLARKPADHPAFGRGEHGCLGIQLARLEMTAVLQALIEKVAGFHIMEAEPLLSNVLRGMKTLRITVTPG